MNLQLAATVETLNAHSIHTAADNCGIRVENIVTDWVEASMPFDKRTQSLDGSLRLGALAILAESVGSLAASIAVDSNKFVCLGQTIEVIHLESAKTGPVSATATPLMIEESNRQIWQIEISDATPMRIALAKLSVVILPRANSSA
jgi:1,4-dihydroxy-2-naphthoyl-CoA hydrolase